jgi:hypothetical protein
MTYWFTPRGVYLGTCELVLQKVSGCLGTQQDVSKELGIDEARCLDAETSHGRLGIGDVSLDISLDDEGTTEE